MNSTQIKKNRWMYGLGTVGRDMVYSLFSMQLMFYLTDVLEISLDTLFYVTIIMMIVRVFDAVNDPFMGVLVDNTKSRWGKFKPWILVGVIISGIFTIIMFTDFQLRGAQFLVMFTTVYVLWEISFTANDIAYWSMLPSLSSDQKERERIGAIARICANIGLFTFVVGVVPITHWLAGITGSLVSAYTVFAISLVVIMWFFQMFTLVGVKEEIKDVNVEETTKVSELFGIIFNNDQLLWTTVSMVLFQVGYMSTTSFGLYYFKYVFGDEGMYSVFAAILGISQLAALTVFPRFSKHYNRKQLYFAATILVVSGYLVFFFSPSHMLFIGVAGILLFVGQAFIQLLMLMFISDTVEYGEWKLGRRNDSVTLSLQPFINKMGSAISAGIVGFTLIISGMKEAVGPQDMTPLGLNIFKLSMLILPLILIVIGYWVYRAKYIIDEKKFEEIQHELQERRNQ